MQETAEWTHIKQDFSLYHAAPLFFLGVSRSGGELVLLWIQLDADAGSSTENMRVDIGSLNNCENRKREPGLPGMVLRN